MPWNLKGATWKGIIFLILVSSCREKHEVNFGGNYYYIPSQEITFDVSGFGGNGIYIHNDSLDGLIPVVFPEILDFKYDSTYIIIKQDFNFSETKTLLENIFFLPQSTFIYDQRFVPLSNFERHAEVANNSIAEQAFIESQMKGDNQIIKMMNNKINYYIINKIKRKTLGPLDKDSFKRKREELNFSINF